MSCVDAILQGRRERLFELCRRFNVVRLSIFGSVTNGYFEPGVSDLDFLVEFGPPPNGVTLARQFFGLQEELGALFERPVDLLEETAITNSRLRRTALSSAVNLYAA